MFEQATTLHQGGWWVRPAECRALQEEPAQVRRAGVRTDKTLTGVSGGGSAMHPCHSKAHQDPRRPGGQFFLHSPAC